MNLKFNGTIVHDCGCGTAKKCAVCGTKIKPRSPSYEYGVRPNEVLVCPGCHEEQRKKSQP